MPESTFEIAQLNTQDDADAVMFKLQDLPCVNSAELDMNKRQARVGHTTMISAEDIAAALEEAGYPGQLLEE